VADGGLRIIWIYEEPTNGELQTEKVHDRRNGVPESHARGENEEYYRR